MSANVEELKYSKGNWKPGKTGGTVVTDNPEGFPKDTGHDSVEYYGGYLIAESIWKKEDVKLLAASKDLLEALQSIVDYWNAPQKGSMNDHMNHIFEIADKAIKKATE